MSTHLARFHRFGLSAETMAKVGDQAVYVVRSVVGDYWKVGLSSNVLQRLVALEENLPFKIEVVVLARTDDPQLAVDLERRILGRLEEWRCRGEWHFVPEAELPFFVWRLDRALQWPAGLVTVEGPGFARVEPSLTILEALGISTRRKPAERRREPRLRCMADLMDDHVVQDALGYAQWHLRTRLGAPP